MATLIECKWKMDFFRFQILLFLFIVLLSVKSLLCRQLNNVVCLSVSRLVVVIVAVGFWTFPNRKFHLSVVFFCICIFLILLLPSKKILSSLYGCSYRSYCYCCCCHCFCCCCCLFFFYYLCAIVAAAVVVVVVFITCRYFFK